MDSALLLLFGLAGGLFGWHGLVVELVDEYVVVQQGCVRGIYLADELDQLWLRRAHPM